MSINYYADTLRRMMDAKNISVRDMVEKLRSDGLSIPESTVYMVLGGKTQHPGRAVCWRLAHALDEPIWRLVPDLQPSRSRFPLTVQAAIRIIEAQARAGLRDAEMAQRLDLSPAEYDMLISGKVRDMELVKRVLARLGIDPAEVGFGKPQPEPDDFVEVDEVDVEEEPQPEPAPEPEPAPVFISVASQEAPGEAVAVQEATEAVAPAPAPPSWLEPAQWLLGAMISILEWQDGRKERPGVLEQTVVEKLAEAAVSAIREPSDPRRPQNRLALLAEALDVVLKPDADLDSHGSLIARAFVALKGRREPGTASEQRLYIAFTSAVELIAGDGEEEELGQ